MKPEPPPTVIYVSWAESCSRSDHTARELGGRSYMVYAPLFGSRVATSVFKYAVQWLRTARLLRREQPEAVFVMTPPLVAALPAFWYAKRHGGHVVLDAHSAAFLHPRWRRLLWLQRALCRRAVTTVVHNDHLARLVRDAGGHATVVPDVPIEFDDQERFHRPPAFTVAVVCSFNYDEPIREILSAAARLPDIQFFLTGNPKHFDAGRGARLPDNVRLTGFLRTAAYGGLLNDADVVMALTSRDHTMSRGAYEALYQGTPVIVSNWPLLRDAFSQGAVHTDNTPDDICRAVREVQARPEFYRDGACRLREAMRRRWQENRAALLGRLRAARSSRSDNAEKFNNS